MNNIVKTKEVFFKCDDHAETAVFTCWEFKDDDINYEFTIEDSYCGGDYMGIKGRFKRAWCAFWAKPIYYSGVFTEDKERMKKFLEDCLELIGDD